MIISFIISFFSSVAVLVLLYSLYWFSFRHRFRKRAWAECWWLPGWNSFRFVIRNMPVNYRPFSIKYRAWLRNIESAKNGCSVNTFVDTEIDSGERILLSGPQDLPVLCFRFENHKGVTKLIHTDKVGIPIKEYNISPSVDALKIEYYLRLQRWFLFKHEIVRTFEIPHYLEVKGKKVDIFQEYFLKKQLGQEQKISPVFMTAEVITVAI